MESITNTNTIFASAAIECKPTPSLASKTIHEDPPSTVLTFYILTEIIAERNNPTFHWVTQYCSLIRPSFDSDGRFRANFGEDDGQIQNGQLLFGCLDIWPLPVAIIGVCDNFERIIVAVGEGLIITIMDERKLRRGHQACNTGMKAAKSCGF